MGNTLFKPSPASGLTNPMTTGGDIIYGGAGGAPTRLANGTSGQLLKSTGSTNAPAWAWPLSTVTSVQTGTYAILATDNVVLVNPSAGAFTATLPTAVGVTGQVYEIICTATGTSTNVCSIATTSAQTIGGFASAAIKLGTRNESLRIVSDGTNWQIIGRNTNLAYGVEAWTPTGSWILQGGNTPVYTGVWSRVADHMHARVKVAITGAVTNASLTINLPANFTIDTAKLTSTTANMSQLGISNLKAAGNSTHANVSYTSTTAVVMTFQSGATTTNATQSLFDATHPATFANADEVNLNFWVPITSWSC